MSNNKKSVNMAEVNKTTTSDCNKSCDNPKAVAVSDNDIMNFLQEKGVVTMVVQPLLSGGVMIYGKEVNNKEAKSLISQIKQNSNYFEKVIGISDEDEEEETIDVYELPDGSLVEAVTPAEFKTAKVVKAKKLEGGELEKVI